MVNSKVTSETTGESWLEGEILLSEHQEPAKITITRKSNTLLVAIVTVAVVVVDIVEAGEGILVVVDELVLVVIDCDVV